MLSLVSLKRLIYKWLGRIPGPSMLSSLKNRQTHFELISLSAFLSKKRCFIILQTSGFVFSKYGLHLRIWNRLYWTEQSWAECPRGDCHGVGTLVRKETLLQRNLIRPFFFFFFLVIQGTAPIREMTENSVRY